MKDFKCDLNCPATGGVFLNGFCCTNCSSARKYHINENNKHFWNDENGFFEKDKGCRLPREQMPQECREYDCHERTYYICSFMYSQLAWDSKKWIKKKPFTLFVRGEVNEDHVENLFKRLKQDITKLCNE